jgi:hypothetical protein
MDRLKPTKRRWFRFSLRTMFVLVTVGCVWMAYHLNWIRQRREMMEWLELLDRKHGLVGAGTYNFRDDPRPDLPFSLSVFGEQKEGLIFICLPDDMDESASEKWFNKVQRLFPEAHLIRPGVPSQP